MKDDGDGLTVCYIYILEKARYQKERVYISDSFVMSNFWNFHDCYDGAKLIHQFQVVTQRSWKKKCGLSQTKKEKARQKRE